MTKVSVVIPTIGRTSLLDSINSATSQDFEGTIEVIVVVDRLPDTVGLPPFPEGVVTIWSGGVGGGQARNLGVRYATGDFIAFLDDDDEWHPEKLAKQLDFMKNTGCDVVSCRHTHAGFGDGTRRLPQELISPGERVADYLFHARRLSAGRASIYTSTILVRGSLAKSIPWTPDLPRHQDWDWLLRVAEAGFAIRHAPETLVAIQLGSPNSVSASARWDRSLSWARDVLQNESPKTYVDFLTAQPLRYAIAARSFGGMLKVVREASSRRTIPSLSCFLIAATAVFPRRLLEAAMAKSS